MPAETVLLAEDETDLLLFPLLRAGWGHRGEPLEVPISGKNARRVVFGALNLRTGHRLVEVRRRGRAEDFQAFLDLVREHYGGRPVAMLLDERSIHTAESSHSLADDLDVELIFLPVRSPKLNPIDHLWGHVKPTVLANWQYPSIDEQSDQFVLHLLDLSPRRALRLAGVLSKHFWMKDVL